MKNFLSGVLKLFLALVVLVVVFAAGFSLNEFSFDGKNFESPVVLTRPELVKTLDAELSPEVIELSQRVSDTTKTLGVIMQQNMRIHHYVGGHDSKHPLEFCPECALISCLDKRMVVLDNEITALSDKNQNLEKNSPEYQENAKQQVALQSERLMIQTYLFNIPEMESKISKLVRASEVDENGNVKFSVPADYGKNLSEQWKDKKVDFLTHPVAPVRTPEQGDFLRKINAMNKQFLPKKGT